MGTDRTPPRQERHWRAVANSAVRGARPPRLAIGLPGDGDAVSQREARSVVDVALRAGEAMLATGASASDVVATVLRLTAAYGLHSTHVDVTFTSLTISSHRGLDEDPLTVMRVIRQRSTDYARLQHVQELIERATEGEAPPPIADVRRGLARILDAPTSYRPWVVTAGQGLLGAGVVLLFGGGPAMVLVAGVTTALVHLVSRGLGRIGFATFFIQAVGAAIPTAMAVGIYWLQSQGLDLPFAASPSLVAIAGIVVLLAGLTVMGAAQDAIDGYYVTATARGLEVIMLTLGIAVGLSSVLSIARRFDVPMELLVEADVVTSPVLSMIAAALIGTGYAISAHAGPRTTAICAVHSGAVWGLYLLLVPLQLAHSVTVAVAALAGAVAGNLAQRHLRVSALATTTAAIVSLLPGLAVYRGLYLMVREYAGFVSAGLAQLVGAAATGLGLAAGISIGAYLVRRVSGWDRAERRVSRSRQATQEP